MTKSGVVVTVLAMTGLAHAQAKSPPATLESQLKDIVAKEQAKKPTPVVRARGCAVPTKAERADVTKRALAWIDTQHPTEKGETVVHADSAEVIVNVACKEASGAFLLDVSQDRVPKKSKDTIGGKRRNYVMRVSPTAVEVIAEDTSDHSQHWMEWADQGRISLLAYVDVDGDGAPDVVYSDHEHEGGSMNSYDRIHVKFATGKLGESGEIMNMRDATVVGGQFIVSTETSEGHGIVVCLGRDLHLAPCAAAKPMQAVADRRWAVEQLSFPGIGGDMPDKEQLAQLLASVGIPAKRRAQLVALAPETQASDRVQRKVMAFLVKASLVEPEPMPALVKQAHPEARKYLDDLATKLGDLACTRTPLSAEEEKRANAWVKKQDAKAHDVAIAATACGPYTWVGWLGESDGIRRQVLLGRDGTRLLGFTAQVEMPRALGDDGLDHVDGWFTHDGTIVGVATNGSNLWVIANGKVVATTKGTDLALYRADDRFAETSTSVFIDGGTLWHATPTGREKLDRALIKYHEDRRAAIALLASGAVIDAKYIAALQLLGADKALIAEAKKLL